MNRFWDKYDIEDALIKDGEVHIPTYYRERMKPEMRKHISQALHALGQSEKDNYYPTDIVGSYAYAEVSYWIPYLRVFFQETFDVLNVEYTDYEFYRLFCGFMKEHGFQWKLGVVVTKMRSQTLLDFLMKYYDPLEYQVVLTISLG